MAAVAGARPCPAPLPRAGDLTAACDPTRYPPVPPRL